jgi:hypothetical protein
MMSVRNQRAQQTRQRHGFRPRPARRLRHAENREGKQTWNADGVEGGPPAVDYAAGAYAASPMPTKTRASSNIAKVWTWLVKIVAKLQKTTPPAMMRERWKRSAKNPKEC